MHKKDIVIVVPIYKAQLNITEQRSLEQLYRVLKDYNIVFVAPKRMRDYCNRQRYSVVYYDDFDVLTSGSSDYYCYNRADISVKSKGLKR